MIYTNTQHYNMIYTNTDYYNMMHINTSVFGNFYTSTLENVRQKNSLESICNCITSVKLPKMETGRRYLHPPALQSHAHQTDEQRIMF